MKITAIYKDKSLWKGDTETWAEAPQDIVAMRLFYDEENSLLISGEDKIVFKEDDQFLFVYMWKESEPLAITILVDKKSKEQTLLKMEKPDTSLKSYEEKVGDSSIYQEKDQFLPYIDLLLNEKA